MNVYFHYLLTKADLALIIVSTLVWQMTNQWFDVSERFIKFAIVSIINVRDKC